MSSGEAFTIDGNFRIYFYKFYRLAFAKTISFVDINPFPSHFIFSPTLFFFTIVKIYSLALNNILSYRCKISIVNQRHFE